MADEADLAFDSEQRHLTHALAAQRSRTSALRAVGICHHCGNDEGLADRLFCDSACAAVWLSGYRVRRGLGVALPARPPRAGAVA